MSMLQPKSDDQKNSQKRNYDDISKKYYSAARSYLKYCTDMTVKQNQIEKELVGKSLDLHPSEGMLGAPEVFQIGKNFIRLIKAKKCLDIGTFIGASAFAWASAIPDDGKVNSIDINHELLNSIGKPIMQKAIKTASKINFIKSDGIQYLNELISNGEAGTWDFAFINADKINYPNYYKKVMILLRPGGVVLLGNVLMDGTTADFEDDDDEIIAIRQLNINISEDDKCGNFLLSVGDGTHIIFKY